MKPSRIETGVHLDQADIMRLFEHARIAEEAGTMPNVKKDHRYDTRQLIGRREALLGEAGCREVSNLVIDAISGYRSLQEYALIDRAENIMTGSLTEMAERGFKIQTEEWWLQQADAVAFQEALIENLQVSADSHRV